MGEETMTFQRKPITPSEMLDDILDQINSIYKRLSLSLQVVEKYIGAFNKIISSLKEKSHIPEQPKHLKGCQDFLDKLHGLKNNILTLQRTIKKRSKRIEKHKKQNIQEAIYYSVKSMNKFMKESHTILQHLNSINQTLNMTAVKKPGDENGVRPSNSNSSSNNE